MVDVLTDPQLWLLVLALSIVGAFARLANYYLGLRGKDAILSIYPRIKPETWNRVLLSFRRLDKLPLLLSSIPFIGSILTIGAGMAGVGRNGFLVWVTISKIIRNWILVLLIWWLL